MDRWLGCFICYYILGLTVFGEGAGDTRGGPEDEGAFGPVTFSVPVIYLEARQYTAFVSSHEGELMMIEQLLQLVLSASP